MIMYKDILQRTLSYTEVRWLVQNTDHNKYN